MPFDFQQLANFRLARGSHKQPNKDGNICVNEAAVIVRFPIPGDQGCLLAPWIEEER